MLLRLLIVSAVVCHSLAMFCGRFHRKCGVNAECKNKKCTCLDFFFGAPLVECHTSDKFQCVIQADPHCTAFAGATANLNFPCKYRMTRLQTPLEGAVPGLSFCAFEVFGYNEIINGKHFTSGVEISFAIGDFANQFFNQVDLIKFDINPDGVESSDGGATEWGTGVHSSWNNITVECRFNSHHRFAILSVPRCNFWVRFRPFNPEEPKGAQSQVPAISIVTGKDTIFGETEIGRYPASLCGETERQGDNSQLYIDRATQLGLPNRHLALLYDALNQGLEQTSFLDGFTDHVLQDKDTCQAVVDEFQECSHTNKQTAIHVCGKILSRKRITKCLGIKALTAFRGCVHAVCIDHNNGCSTYNSVFAETGCKPRSKICKE